MSDLSITKQVMEIVKKITRNENIDEESSYLNSLGWDSLVYIAIAIEIEEKFDVKISDQNINRFTSILEIVKLIQEKNPT